MDTNVFWHGLGFLAIFLIEVILTIIWIITFKIYQCYKPNTISFQYYARWLLCLWPIFSALDNLRIFCGSFISQSFASSSEWENYFLFVSLLHFVLLPTIIVLSAMFLIIPRCSAFNMQFDDDSTDKECYFTETKSNLILWITAWILTLLLTANGIYAWISFKDHTEFTNQYKIYRWKTDENWVKNEGNIFQILAEQQPVFVCIIALIMNIIIIKRYRFYWSFILTLITIIGTGLLVNIWEFGFFFIANFFEFTFYLSFYLLDRFMYGNKSEIQENHNKYYQLSSSESRVQRDSGLNTKALVM